MEHLKPIRALEQERLTEEDNEYFQNLDLDFDDNSNKKVPLYLGISKDGECSYYIGATWLKTGSRPLVVLPKFPDIDFISIFANAISNNISPNYFEEAYSINFDAPLIYENALNSVLSPLIVAHYLSIIKKLLKRGLKKNYIIIEENKKNKIRGHILPLKNLQQNIARGHSERVLCRYQEYSFNYCENQLLKRALLASENLLVSYCPRNSKMLQIVRNALTEFEGISADITPSQVKSIKNDKLHGEYPQAIELAKRILRRTDFSINDSQHQEQGVPEFSIDMSRIFEFHVLDFLAKKFPNAEILFQENAGVMGRCDYLIPSEKLIIDAKYKANYPKRNNREDIREVSGYARAERIRKICNIKDSNILNCLIIYPNDYGETLISNKNIIEESIHINGIANFYTLGIKIPKIE